MKTQPMSQSPTQVEASDSHHSFLGKGQTIGSGTVTAGLRPHGLAPSPSSGSSVLTTHHRRRRLLPSLDALTDVQLYAVLVRVQTLLLNRPHSRMRLAVDLVSDDEAHLLTLYRALPRPRRHTILTVVEQFYTDGAQVMRTQEGNATVPARSPDDLMRMPS
jgi:hypothetical protein